MTDKQGAPAVKSWCVRESNSEPFDRSAFLTCECGSEEHLARFAYFAPDERRPEDGASLYLSIHIRGWEGFWRRLWTAVKYAAGYRSKYGEWDEVIVTRRSAREMRDLCDEFLRATEGGCER